MKNNRLALLTLALFALCGTHESRAVAHPLSGGAVAGITIASVAGAALFGYGIYRIVKHEKNKKYYPTSPIRR